MNKDKAIQKLEELKSSFDKQSRELMEIINKPSLPTSFEEVCQRNGVSPSDILPFKHPQNKEEISTNGYHKLCQIRKLINRPGYEPNYADSNEAKWKCIWEYKAGSGFVFYYSHAFYYYAAAFGGPLLDCETQEIADYFATQFPAEWKEYLEG